MKYMTFKEMFNKAKEFYDTIDFEPFFEKYSERISGICMTDLWMDLQRYYDDEHPELLPEDFQGDFFNFVSEDEFVDYLKERYDFGVRECTVTHYYLMR